MRTASRSVLLSVTALTAIIVQATPSLAVNPTTTPIKTGPNVDEYEPAAVTGYLTWEQNSVSSPNHFDVFAEPRAGGVKWKVNVPRTSGFGPSPIPGTQAIIYQQASGSTSDLYQYNFSTMKRTKLPAKINSSAWEYRGAASKSYIAFMRLTATARLLLLYNRATGRVTQIASTKPKCGSCLSPTWVGAFHLLYEVCSPRTFACQIKAWTKGATTQTVPNAEGAGYSQYSGAMDEATGDIYYFHTTTWCGLFTEIRRWNLAGGSPVTIYDFDEGIDGNTLSLAPDEVTPSDTDLLFSQYDCVGNDSDIYQIASVNLL